MVSAHVVVTDEGYQLDLLRTPPYDLKLSLQAGIQRWQAIRILQHIPEAIGNERVWVRGLRHGILSIKDASRRAAATCLIGSALWPPARRKAAGFCDSDLCTFCDKMAVGTLGHQIYDCESVLDFPRSQGLCYPDDVLERRSELREKGEPGLGVPDWDTLELVYGFPFQSVALAPVPDQLPVYSWGATEARWERRIYTDGSGLANGSPELRRCGWSAVELGPRGLPIRAVYGALPGRHQSVPRAERLAIYHALRVGPADVHVVSDHWSAVQEGQSWDPSLASGTSKSAGLWRRVFQMRKASRPTFSWTPAHRDWSDVYCNGDPGDIQDFLGNLWADFFARLGADTHAAAETVVKFQQAQLPQVKLTYDFLSRFAQSNSRTLPSVQGPITLVSDPLLR